MLLWVKYGVMCSGSVSMKFQKLPVLFKSKESSNKNGEARSNRLPLFSNTQNPCTSTHRPNTYRISNTNHQLHPERLKQNPGTKSRTFNVWRCSKLNILPSLFSADNKRQTTELSANSPDTGLLQCMCVCVCACVCLCTLRTSAFTERAQTFENLSPSCQNLPPRAKQETRPQWTWRARETSRAIDMLFWLPVTEEMSAEHTTGSQLGKWASLWMSEWLVDPASVSRAEECNLCCSALQRGQG